MRIIFPVGGFGTRIHDDIFSSNSSNRLAGEIIKVSKPNIGVAKALVPIKGTPALEHSINKLTKLGVEVNNIYVVTNQAFLEFFQQWAKQFGFPLSNLICDGKLTNETRLESCAAINLAISQTEIDDDILVIAGDTLFNGDISGLLALNSQTEHDIVAFYQESSLEMMRKRGNLIFEGGYLIDFQEKPVEPKTLQSLFSKNPLCLCLQSLPEKIQKLATPTLSNGW